MHRLLVVTALTLVCLAQPARSDTFYTFLENGPSQNLSVTIGARNEPTHIQASYSCPNCGGSTSIPLDLIALNYSWIFNLNLLNGGNFMRWTLDVTTDR